MYNTPATIISVLMQTNSNAIVKVVEDLFAWKEDAYNVDVTGVVYCKLSSVLEIAELFDELIKFCQPIPITTLCWKQTYQHFNQRETLRVEIENMYGSTVHGISFITPDEELSYSILNDHKLWTCLLIAELYKREINILDKTICCIRVKDGAPLPVSPYADGSDNDLIRII